MNLFTDLKEITRKHLDQLNVQYPAAANVEDLLLLAINHERKTIRAIPRVVHASPEFESNRKQLNAQMQSALTEILSKFERGEDVNGHLNTQSITPERRDPMIPDWAIYHLHISNHKTNQNGMFYARTGLLAFVWVTDSDAYFVDIAPHGSWTRQEFLRIIDRTWPDLLKPFKLQSATTANTPSDADLKMLRKANVNVIVPLGNSVIAPPGGGLAKDGTPVQNSERADVTMYLIKNLGKFVSQNSDRLKSEIADKTGHAPNDLDFELIALSQQRWGVHEKKTGVLVARSQ